MGAASAQRPAYHCWLSLHATRRAETLRLPGRHTRRAAADVLDDGSSRGIGILRRPAHSSRVVYSPGGVHFVGGDGGGLFYEARAERVLAVAESRGVGCALLLPLSLPVPRRR